MPSDVFPASNVGRKAFMYDLNQISKRVKELRRKKGLTQERVAAELGVNIKTYKLIERGKRVGSIDTLCLIAEYYDVSLDYLMSPSRNLNEEMVVCFARLSPERRILAERLVIAMFEVLKG